MTMLYVFLLTVVLLKLTHSINQKLINPRNQQSFDHFMDPTPPTRRPPTRPPTRSPTVITFNYTQHGDIWYGKPTGDFRCTEPYIRGKPTTKIECPRIHQSQRSGLGIEMKCDRRGWCSALKEEGEACIDVNECRHGIHYCHPVTSKCSYGNLIGEGCGYLADDHFSECDKRSARLFDFSRFGWEGEGLSRTSGCGKRNVCHGLVTNGQSCSVNKYDHRRQQYMKKENLAVCSLYKYDYPDVTSGDKAAWYFFQESTTSTDVNGKSNVGKVDPICIPVKFSFQENSLTLPSDDFVCERKHALGEKCRYTSDCVGMSTERTGIVRTICFRDPALKDGLVEDSHGFCHHERGIGETCIDDNDCGSQDYYEGTLQDVSGCVKSICHGTRATGSNCNFQYECDPQSNKLCFQSKCAPLREPGETCEKDFQCKFSACRLGKCLILKKLGETCDRPIECDADAAGCYFSPEAKQRLCLSDEPGKRGNTLTSESTRNVLEWIAESTLRHATAGYCYRPPAKTLRCGKDQVRFGLNCYKPCDGNDEGIGAVCMCGLFCYYGRVPANQAHAWIWTCEGLDNYHEEAGMCYHDCPPTHKYRCGIGCTVDGDTCFSSTLDMVMAPLSIVANMVTLGSSSVLMKAFDFAVGATMTAYTIIKANLDEIWNAVSAGGEIDVGWPNWVKRELHLAGCHNGTACHTSLAQRYMIALRLAQARDALGENNFDFVQDVARLPRTKEYETGEFYTLNLFSVGDPSGLIGLMTAYSKPDCWYPPKVADLIVFN